MEYLLLEGESLEVMKEMDDNSVDSVVTDPPYGLKFMGKKWDHSVPSVALWKEAYRVLKAGGHMLVACGTRTQHRMVSNIEDAGFEIRDVITWHYGSGFPKSLDVSKAIDKQAGAEREVVGVKYTAPDIKGNSFNADEVSDRKRLDVTLTAPSTDEAKQWNGWGTALKPATEFWTLCRKPLSEKTVALNVLKYGTGGINIDESRVEFDAENENFGKEVRDYGDKAGGQWQKGKQERSVPPALGRFPANVIFDDFTANLLDEQTGILKSGNGAVRNNSTTIDQTFAGIKPQGLEVSYNDLGGASRFFYVAKPSKKERNGGLEGWEPKECKTMGERNPDTDGSSHNTTGQVPANHQNNHPTVKPIKLMQYLVRLITPTGGTCLDMFNGSGTTGCACALEGFDYIGIDKNDEGVDCIGISEARIEHHKNISTN